MREERKWEERKWRGKKMGEKMLSLIMLGWMRENRKEGKWVGEVEHGHWTMMCNFSLSYNPPILGGKLWEENGACGPPTFPLPFSFLSHFLPIQARENTPPHPIFLSHFLSSPIFPPSKHYCHIHWTCACIAQRWTMLKHTLSRHVLSKKNNMYKHTEHTEVDDFN